MFITVTYPTYHLQMVPPPFHCYCAEKNSALSTLWAHLRIVLGIVLVICCVLFELTVKLAQKVELAPQLQFQACLYQVFSKPVVWGCAGFPNSVTERVKPHVS